MSVHQTREYFLSKYGSIVDNPRVGAELAEVYWRPGNSEQFLDLVHKLTGKPLKGDSWVHDLNTTVEEALEHERKAYERSVKEGPKFKHGDHVSLDMRVLLVHGDEVVADSKENGSLFSACEIYRKWLNDNKANWQ